MPPYALGEMATPRNRYLSNGLLDELRSAPTHRGRAENSAVRLAHVAVPARACPDGAAAGILNHGC